MRRSKAPADPALWCVRCASCGEHWPATAFRVLWLFTSRRCEPCRGVGSSFARMIHYMIWPFGIPRAPTTETPGNA